MLLNHSCDENLVIVPVYTDIQDAALPLLAFFAQFDIPPGSELCVNYGAGFIKQRMGGVCLCGSVKCRF